jgi:HEPN domain-containing protein
MSPQNQDKIFKKEYSAELFRIAQGDFASAKGLATVSQGRPENILYLVQQSIEKALKAVLCSLGLPVPLVHDLAVLVAKLPKELKFIYGYELNELNDYATIRRYEEGVSEINKKEISSCIKIAENVLSWADPIINKNK